MWQILQCLVAQKRQIGQLLLEMKSGAMNPFDFLSHTRFQLPLLLQQRHHVQFFLQTLLLVLPDSFLKLRKLRDP